jgi:hypothetical protein
MAREDDVRRQYQDRSDHSTLGTAVQIGAIIGAGALGWKYRRQIGAGLRPVGEFAGTLAASGAGRLARSERLKDTIEDIGTFAKSMHYATDSRGAFSHMSNQRRFKDRFDEALDYSLEERARSKRTTIGGGPLQALQEFQDTRNALKMVRQEVFETHRMEHISKELNDAMPDFMKAGLESQLALRGQGWLYNMSQGKVEAFTEHLLSKQGKKELAHNISFKNDVEKKKFEEQLFSTLKKYENRKAEGFALNPEARKKMNAVEKKVKREIVEGYRERNSNREDFVSKVMQNGGWRRATINDLKHHENGDLLAQEWNAMRTPLVDSRKSPDGHVAARMGSKMGKMEKGFDRKFGNIVADQHLWINANGEFMDMRWMAKGGVNLADGFRNSVQVPFLRFNPLDLMHFTTWEGMRNAPKTHFKAIGTIDPALHGAVKELQHPLAHNQDAAVGILGRGYVNTANGKVFDLTTGDLVKEQVYQMSARFGLGPRMMSGMANLHSRDLRGDGFLANLFDYKFSLKNMGNGRQESDTIGSRSLSTLTKFDDYEWGPNIHNGMARWLDDAYNGIEEAERYGLSPESGYKLMYSQLESKTASFSYDTAKHINERVKSAYGDIGIDLMKLNTEEEIMSAFGRLNSAILTPNSGAVRFSSKMGGDLEGVDKLVNSMWTKYAQNPTQFSNNQRILPNNAPYMPEWLNALDMHETELVKKVDDVKRLIHMHAARQLEYAEGVTVGSLIKEGISNGALRKGALGEARNLEALTSMRQYWDDVYKNPLEKDGALAEFASKVLDPRDDLSIATQQAMKDMNPTWSMGPGGEPPQHFGFVGNISMNKAKSIRGQMEEYNRLTAAGVSPVAAMFDTAGGYFGQFFAGRKNLGNVTTATMPGYILTERLDNAVAQIGFGLSQQNRGSALSILGNQFGRRIALPYMAYQQAVWLDGMFGDVFSDKASETYANMHEDVGHIKEFLGLNDFGRQWSRVFQGSDQISETPVARAFNFATFGLFDHKSGEEIRDFYESGEVAIRKGRYWGIGSNTPYTGGKIDRYVPNWYRRAKSDYKFTDTMYGSESEYWANHWMPTITNPLAPIRHFFLDPYHYERKHEEDRPYPISGGFSEVDMIPLIGPAINNTVGRVLKPRREHPDLEKAHRAYIEELNANVAAQYEAAGGGGYLQGMPAGGYNLGEVPVSGPGIAGTGAPSAGYGGISGVTPEQFAMMVGDTGGAAGETRRRISAINSMYSDIGGPSLGATGKNVRSLTALEDLRDPDVIADLADIGTMHSVSGTARDTFYSMTEFAGIYGFSTKTLVGFQESGRGMTLEQSSRIGSYQRAFWDMELGGLGGNLSEIGRRYNPRDPNKNYWNPIKNKMPEWLPGSEYFIDFKHGDPYVKIANGEMRLPGDAYETLYKLHPDAFGEYGAFDRFRILADVAPYSENYKFYRRIVSQMNQNGMLSDDMVKEYAEVRDQVSNRKKKYRFYNNRFRNSDVEEETVTITRMLDATTFLTKEYGNNPIRMAGVKVRADDEETQTWLQQYVHEGAKVRIAVDADPLFRVRDDTYNTIRAVVYANKNDEYAPFYQSTKGQNVNFMLANRKTGGLMGLGGKVNATVHDDGSATATQALFSKDMVTVGKLWEFATHDLLPSIPVFGTIADKFLQIRSPLEMYKKQEVYGKAWRPWTDPIGGWIQPMVDSLASKHPVVGAAQGAGIGWLFAKKGAAKFWGTRIGAVIGGGVATARVFLEQGRSLRGNDEQWLPERREKEREINEYFDKIKYIKYRGLYERARREALRREGVDLNEILSLNSERGEQNKAQRNVLERTKKWLSMNKKLGYGDREAVDSQLDQVRADLKAIEADRPGMRLGEYSMLALRYKAEYESTLYGADANGDMTKIFRALPAKDREFFTEFMKAAPDEREEILRLVPKDQRRFYQAKWGLDQDKKESLRSYFTGHYLPDENWAGWRQDVSLENYKIKVVKNEALEMTEFGYWDDDVQRAEESNAKPMKMRSVGDMLDVTRLEKALIGAGLNDVSVSMSTQQTKGENKISLAMDFTKDRSDEIISEINNNLGGLFG